MRLSIQRFKKRYLRNKLLYELSGPKKNRQCSLRKLGPTPAEKLNPPLTPDWAYTTTLNPNFTKVTLKSCQQSGAQKYDEKRNLRDDFISVYKVLYCVFFVVDTGVLADFF
jgi:hypothetical protein